MRPPIIRIPRDDVPRTSTPLRLNYLESILPLLNILVLVLLVSAPLASCYPQLQHEFRERTIALPQLQDSYDYIIVGGGQSGLVVANRLSEDPNVTVLIIEYGYFDNSTRMLQPQSATSYPRQDMYNLTSIPQKGLNGSRQTVYAAYVVGGGSAINGMMLNRGAARDYDNWEKLNNSGWGWNDLLPYFVKSTMFQAPSPQLQQEFNITWNSSSYGTDGPIHVSYAPFQWPGIKVQYRGLVEAGAVPQLDGADGHAYGVFWYTSAVDNTTVTRSYARNRYFDPVANRTNLHILTGWRVNDIQFDGVGSDSGRQTSSSDSPRATGVRMQQRGTPNGDPGSLVAVKADKEVILAAGALHTPQVLQRSGVGPRWLLDQAKIPVVLDLPGVGSNLQDHPVGKVSFSYDTDVWPNPTEASTNSTFLAWQQQQWEKYRSGPMSQTTGNTAGLLPLKLIAPDRWKNIVDMYRDQNASEYLPSTYSPEQVSGYEAQRTILADSLEDEDNAVIEFPIQATGNILLLQTKEVSRGTAMLDPNDIYAEPVLDYGTFINPVDVFIGVESIRFARVFHTTKALQSLSPREQAPGTNITSDEDLLAVVRSTSTSSAAHISGTCSMMPRELAGVVGPDLLVYGLTGVSVVDSSIMPLIPGAHICATVYAVAEKAADIIKKRHKTA